MDSNFETYIQIRWIHRKLSYINYDESIVKYVNYDGYIVNYSGYIINYDGYIVLYDESIIFVCMVQNLNPNLNPSIVL